MTKPFFSIVIPTRNRASLLPLAVNSVLQQEFEDFELIISDNFSSDETGDVARSFDNKRVRYVRSEKPLDIGESFDFALTHARGEYFTFLSDDDAQAKVFMKRFYELIRSERADIVTCPLTHYHASDLHNYGRDIRKETLVMPPFSRKVTTLNREEAVNALFGSIRLTQSSPKERSVRFPQLVNTMYHSSLIEKTMARLPRLLPYMAGDVYSMTLFFNLIDKFCFVDEPLSLYCIWQGSETTGQGSFMRHPDERIFEQVPLKKTLTSPNYITNMVLRARSHWGDDYLPVDISWGDYFLTRLRELRFLERGGEDVSEAMEEFEQVLAAQDGDVRAKVANGQVNSPLKDYLRIKLKKTPIGKFLLKRRYSKIRFLTSESHGFANIKECANLIDENFLEKYASPAEECNSDNTWI